MLFVGRMSVKLVDQSIDVDPKKYVNICERNILRVSNKLDDYLKSQEEKNIHDIRTSARRLDASYKTLPRKLRRRKQIRRFVDKSKDLFKINSQVRDFDVISEIIGMNGNPQKHENMIVPKNFEARRTLKLKKAMNVAVGLRKLPLPKIKKSSVSSSKVNRRFNKLIRKYGSRIQLNLPLVMTDANKATELHEMRKDCKKLRYVLESIPHNNTSNNSLFKLEEDLENMQDKLGAIHDCDATVAYLKKSQKKSRTGKDVIKSIMEERKKRYEEFLVHCKSDILNNKRRSELFDIPKPAYNTSKQ